MIKKSLNSVFLLLVIFLTFILFSTLQAQSLLSVNTLEIKCGDPIVITYGKHMTACKLEVKDPAGIIHEVETSLKNDMFQGYFLTDSVKGFITPDWNKYSIYLIKKDQIIDSAAVRLSESEKTLYFTVFIDDVGPYLYLDEADYKWFKDLGGKFNMGYMRDDYGLDDLSMILQKYPDRSDYIFHHFHAQRFNGNQFLLQVYNFTRWKEFKVSVGKMFNTELRDRHFIMFAFVSSFLILLVIFIFFRTKKVIITFLALIFIFNAILIFIIYSYSYVIDLDKKEIMLADKEWCKSFLLDKKNEFEQNGMNYPEITRHGWTIPPRGLGEFYLLEMGVMADQSLDYLPHRESDFYQQDHDIELNQVFAYHVYFWPENVKLPVPFYTNIDGDINQTWNGDESKRGILEIPSTHGPYATQEYDANALRLCDSLPNGALVSCWGHPNRSMENMKPLLSYVRDNFKIQYVNIGEYLAIYLQNNPRPIFIDEDKKEAYWAYLGEEKISLINTCELVNFQEFKIHFDLKKWPDFIILKNKNDDTAERLGYEFDREKDGYYVYKLMPGC